MMHGFKLTIRHMRLWPLVWLLGLVFLSLVCLSISLNAFGRTDIQTIKKQLKPAPGYALSVFATGVRGARLMALTAEGDVLVSQSGSGLVSLIAGNQSNGIGTASPALTLLKGLDRPHGLAIDGNWLYVAEETKVLRYRFDAQKKQIIGKAEMLFDGMPSGGHATRTIAKGLDGWFYVSVGSSCNVCIERHKWRAALIRFKPKANLPPEIYATGLRNTVGYDWHPKTGELYSVDNGRDWLGDDLPPGEVNLIVKGGFYGWPFFNGANVPDKDYGNQYNPAKHGKALGPAHRFKAHVAPLSLRFLKRFSGDMEAVALVSQHGSWNRSKKIGYKVVRLDWSKDGVISQSDFLTGFLQGQTVLGRPVDTLELADGSVLISDDYQGVIWKMSPQ